VPNVRLPLLFSELDVVVPGAGPEYYFRIFIFDRFECHELIFSVVGRDVTTTEDSSYASVPECRECFSQITFSVLTCSVDVNVRDDAK
jgi:hypothetical protein